MSTPSVTPVQIVALVQQVLALLVAFGINVTEAQSIAIVALSGTVGAMLLFADARIRGKRAENADKIAAAKSA